MRGQIGVVRWDDPFFFGIYQLDKFLGSGFGVGLAIAALAIGAIVGIAKTSALPAVTGVAVAFVITVGPDIVLLIFGATI